MKDKSDNVIVEKSKAFALRIIKLYTYLTEKKKEFVISKQILKSGTSIGANVREAIRGYSKADFYAKLSISLKEASETEYWLELLNESGFLKNHENEYTTLYAECQEIIKILVSIIKTRRNEIHNYEL